VTSAVVKRAQAEGAEYHQVDAERQQPCRSVLVSTGERSRESNEFHQCVGRYGWTTEN